MEGNKREKWMKYENNSYDDDSFQIIAVEW